MNLSKLVAVLGCMIVGCGAKVDDGPRAVDASAFMTACVGLNTQLAQRADACHVSAWLDGPRTIRAYCEAMAAEIRSGSVVYSDATLDACRSDIDAADCCDVQGRFWSAGPDGGYGYVADTLRSSSSCHALLRGARGPGEACGTLGECQDGLYCFGTCQAALPEGAECGGKLCAEGLTCADAIPANGTLHCTALKQLGEGCGGGAIPNPPQCAPGLACVDPESDSSWIHGTCVASPGAVPAGPMLDACKTNAQPLPTDGQDCEAGCRDAACVGVTTCPECENSPTFPGKCVPYASLGEACDTVDPLVNPTKICSRGLACDAATSTCIADPMLR